MHFVRKSGKLYGPIGDEKLFSLFQAGKLLPEDQVAPSKEGPWLPAADVLRNSTEPKPQDEKASTKKGLGSWVELQSATTAGKIKLGCGGCLAAWAIMALLGFVVSAVILLTAVRLSPEERQAADAKRQAESIASIASGPGLGITLERLMSSEALGDQLRKRLDIQAKALDLSFRISIDQVDPNVKAIRCDEAFVIYVVEADDEIHGVFARVYQRNALKIAANDKFIADLKTSRIEEDFQRHIFGEVVSAVHGATISGSPNSEENLKSLKSVMLDNGADESFVEKHHGLRYKNIASSNGFQLAITSETTKFSFFDIFDALEARSSD